MADLASMKRSYSYTTFNKAGVKFNPFNAAMLSNLGIDHAVMQRSPSNFMKHR